MRWYDAKNVANIRKYQPSRVMVFIVLMSAKEMSKTTNRKENPSIRRMMKKNSA